MIKHSCVEVKTCVQNTKPELCCDHSAWDLVVRADAIQWANVLIPLDNITCSRRVQAWNIRLYCYLAQCFDGITTQMIHILWLLSHSRREEIYYLHLHVFSGFFLISSGTIMWNMHDEEPTTYIKFINLHKNSRQNLMQQIYHKAHFASILSDQDQTKWW